MVTNDNARGEIADCSLEYSQTEAKGCMTFRSRKGTATSMESWIY